MTRSAAKVFPVVSAVHDWGRVVTAAGRPRRQHATRFACTPIHARRVWPLARVTTVVGLAMWRHRRRLPEAWLAAIAGWLAWQRYGPW
jgi:hypothetical protein